jgi:hypothetical protein
LGLILIAKFPPSPRSKRVNSADGIPVSAYEMSNSTLLNGRLKARLKTQLVLSGFSMALQMPTPTHVYSIVETAGKKADIAMALLQQHRPALSGHH